MPIRRYVLRADLHTLRWHLGSLLVLYAVLLVVPLLVAIVIADLPRVGAFAATGAGCGALGWLARRREEPRLDRREALLIVALTYLVFAALGALAFVGELPLADAFFEAMSGFTTTGLTLLDVEQAPASLLFFRAYSQWIGGAGIIVISLVVLSGSGSAMSRLYATEFGQENLLGSVVATARMVGAIYAGLTALGYAALLLAGAGPFDGLLHALALLSTGGFSPYADSIGAYGDPAVATVTAMGMVLGAISMPLYWLVWRRGWRTARDDVQLRALLVLAAFGSAALIAFHRLDGPGAAVFHALSAITTTGFSLEEAAAWPPGARMTVMALMVVGGGLGSTAGGIKLLRLLLLLALVRWTLYRMLLPKEATVPLKVGDRALGTEDVRMGLALLTGYLLIAVCSMLALSAATPDLEVAAFDVISALSTVGLSAGLTSPELPAWGKLVLAFDMWAGRVEILPVLLLLHPGNWRPQSPQRRRRGAES